MAAESAVSEGARRVGVRRRVVVRVLGLRGVEALRRTVLRPFPVSEPVDSSGDSGIRRRNDFLPDIRIDVCPLRDGIGRR
mgnify:CR=1 FL=1